jgi:hypothetical protein
MAKTQTQPKLTPWEAKCLSEASYFTAVTFHGVGKYERHEVKTQTDAINFASCNPRRRPWGIYVVTAEGRDAHIQMI